MTDPPLSLLPGNQTAFPANDLNILQRNKDTLIINLDANPFFCAPGITVETLPNPEHLAGRPLLNLAASIDTDGIFFADLLGLCGISNGIKFFPGNFLVVPVHL